MDCWDNSWKNWTALASKEFLLWILKFYQVGFFYSTRKQTGGCHSHRLYSHSCDRKVKTLTSSFLAFWPLTTLVFGLWSLTALNFSHWPLTTLTFMEVYGRMRSDSTPSLVYGLTSAVAAVTIESMGVTPPPCFKKWNQYTRHGINHISQEKVVGNLPFSQVEPDPTENYVGNWCREFPKKSGEDT